MQSTLKLKCENVVFLFHYDNFEMFFHGALTLKLWVVLKLKANWNSLWPFSTTYLAIISVIIFNKNVRESNSDVKRLFTAPQICSFLGKSYPRCAGRYIYNIIYPCIYTLMKNTNALWCHLSFQCAFCTA